MICCDHMITLLHYSQVQQRLISEATQLKQTWLGLFTEAETVNKETKSETVILLSRVQTYY